MRILVAGMGNVLRKDDGFGVEVVRRLSKNGRLPAEARLVEIGIGGISLVQELLDPARYGALLVIDALQREGAPGQVYVLEAQVPDLGEFPEAVRRDFLADMHYAVPSRALVLAKALGVLPAVTFIIGCQAACDDELEIGLSPAVAAAVDPAVEKVIQLVEGIRSS